MTPRLTWIISVLLSASTLILLIVTRLTFFYTHPADISLVNKYVPKLEFPQVIICNQDPFRLDKQLSTRYYSIDI